MGQRSQIYIRIASEYDKTPILYAKYYGWNYGERMISRARHGIEYIKAYLEYKSDKNTQEKINKIFDVNFDMKDVIITSDIISEWIEQFSDIYKANEYIFECVDNNDGKLFVDISKDNKIKYCFTDRNMKILSPKQYMDWDFKNWENSEYLDKEDAEICKNNIKYIEENAIQMTEEELQEFINFDYSKQINELAERLGIKIKTKEESELEIIKIGFDYEECSKSGNIITGKGSVYYYANEENYDECKETSIADFRFKYDISKSEIYDVECDNEDAKNRVEMDEDNFIDNLKNNLLPDLEEDSKKDKDITDDIF